MAHRNYTAHAPYWLHSACPPLNLLSVSLALCTATALIVTGVLGFDKKNGVKAVSRFIQKMTYHFSVTCIAAPHHWSLGGRSTVIHPCRESTEVCPLIGACQCTVTATWSRGIVTMTTQNRESEHVGKFTSRLHIPGTLGDLFATRDVRFFQMSYK